MQNTNAQRSLVEIIVNKLIFWPNVRRNVVASRRFLIRGNSVIFHQKTGNFSLYDLSNFVLACGLTINLILPYLYQYTINISIISISIYFPWKALLQQIKASWGFGVLEIRRISAEKIKSFHNLKSVNFPKSFPKCLPVVWCQVVKLDIPAIKDPNTDMFHYPNRQNYWKYG